MGIIARKPYRSLESVPDSELLFAIQRMADELGVPLITDTYNLLQAVLDEKIKDLDAQWILEKEGKITA